MPPPPPPPSEERWSILARIPKVVKDKEAKRTFPPGADVSVACVEPPLASLLSVPVRISPPPSLSSYPYVAGADSSGLLLLCATEPDDEVTYHLCHARTGEVTCLREQHGYRTGFYGANVGLMVRGGSCVVAELLPATDGTGRATLLCYTVGQYKWVVKELAFSPPPHQGWSAESVVSYGGMLWWVELSYGLLACDPLADNPELLHVPLPAVLDQLPVKSAKVNWGAHICVMVSCGKLRYVQIHGSPDAPLVSTWALTEDRKWNPERRRVPLLDIWADESYLNSMLPWSIPALALLDPTDPDKLYFFLESCIFAVDLRRRKTVEFSEFGMPEPANQYIKRSSHLVHAWQCDPSSSWSVPICLRQEKEIAARSRAGRKIGTYHYDPCCNYIHLLSLTLCLDVAIGARNWLFWNSAPLSTVWCCFGITARKGKTNSAYPFGPCYFREHLSEPVSSETRGIRPSESLPKRIPPQRVPPRRIDRRRRRRLPPERSSVGGEQNLYNINVRKIVLMGLPPVGCAPHFLSDYGSQNGECIDYINNVVIEFNYGLRHMSSEFIRQYPDSMISYCDTFEGSVDILENRDSYGFLTTTDACCGLGKYGGLFICVLPQMACSDASSHVWWDEFHPTDAVNRILAENVWSGEHTKMCYPVDLQEMVKLKK